MDIHPQAGANAGRAQQKHSQLDGCECFFGSPKNIFYAFTRQSFVFESKLI